MVLLAAFDVVLYRLTGQRDVRIGVPVVDRDEPSMARLIGVFVNMVVIRGELRGDMPFAELLRAVRRASIGAHANKGLPFERLVDALAPERSATEHPLFQIAFNHRRSDARALTAMPGVRLLDVERFDVTPQFELSLDTEEDREGKLTARFSYDRRFEREAVVAIARRFRRVLAQIAEGRDRLIAEFGLLDGSELDRVERQTKISRATRLGPTVAELIARRAAAHPSACAVVGDGQRLLYGDLERRANRLAHRLRERGVKEETVVAIAADRTPDAIVAMLAVWKAGGAFLALDAAYPAERLAYMLRDSRAALLLADKRVRQRTEWPREICVVVLDEEDSYPASEAPPDVATRPEHLAYIVYTSGSTGQPKGVLVEHGALTMHTLAAGAIYGMNASDSALHFASMSFDAAIEQWAVPLAHGARLVLGGGAAWTVEHTARAVERERVTIVYPPTSHILELAEWAKARDVKLRLRVCCVGGEAVSRASYQRICVDLEPEKIINGYGPTETVITPLLWQAGPGVVCDSAYAPIGRPVGERTAYVLDADLNVVPPGVIGELYIGGLGMARGYHDRAALTARRFVPDPFGGRGSRLYRTGDLVRYAEDGVVEYVGRNDGQVKIRGHRIELGEIEARLLEDDRVEEAVVVVRETRASKRLVAYVSTNSTARAVIEAELREAIGRRLPEFMVPSQIVVLSRLPRTPNGKIDRGALPEPALPSRAYVEPRKDAERALADVWQRLLGVARVGLADHFFELGGDSIVAIQMVSQIRRAGWRLAPRDVFAHPTLQALARAARPGADAGDARGTIPSSSDVPLAPIQAAFFARPLAQRHWYNQALLLTPRQELDRGRLEGAIAALLEHHDALRLRFRFVDGRWEQRYGAADGAAALSVRDLRSWSELAPVVELAQQSLNLEQGPTFRAVLARVPGEGSRLLLVAHHLVVDGVSWRILLEDLEAICRPATCATAPALPDRTSSYQAWSQALRARASAAVSDGELRYWTEQQRRARQFSLPLDFPAAASRRDRADVVTLRLDVDCTSRLLFQTASAHRTQIDELLLTAVARAVGEWANGSIVALELERHGRDAIDPELDLTRTVGWFTATFPVVLPVVSDLSENILAVKESLRAVPHHGIGFGLLSQLAKAESSLQARPPITFNYLGQTDLTFGEGALFDIGSEPVGPTGAPEDPLDNWMVVDGRVERGALLLDWKFSRDMFRTETVRRIADACERELRAIARHCTSGVAFVSPSDFPLASLTAEELRGLPVPADRVEDVYPLTPLQQGILFHSLEVRSSDPYFYQRAFSIEGELDEQAFAGAWRLVAERHAALRTTYHWTWTDRPMQIVSKEGNVAIQFEDWRSRDGAAQWDELRQRLEREREGGFDFSARNAVHLSLLRVEDGVWWLVWSLHHLALDGWSTAIVLRDVKAAYGALCGRATAPLSDVVPFSTYVAWLDAARKTSGADDWGVAWAGFETTTPLPLACAAPATPSSRAFAEQVVSVEPATWDGIRRNASRHDVTLATMLQAAWALLLGLYAGQRDVVFGVTSSGRASSLSGVEQVVGLLIQTLPVRVRWTPEQTIGEWIATNQASFSASEARPPRSISEIQKETSLGEGRALFESIVVVENYPVDPALTDARDPWRIDLLERRVPAGAPIFSKARNNYPLTLAAGLGAAPELTLTYDTARFTATDVAELARQLTHLLERLADDTSRCIGCIGLAVAEGGGTLAGARRQAGPRDLLAAWERHVAERTDAPALYDADGACTYRAIDVAANRLACRLAGAGVGSDVIVALCSDRSRDLVIGILGIWKAGGGYLPIDPRWPKERIRRIVADAGAQQIVASRETACAVEAMGLAVIVIDHDASAAPSELHLQRPRRHAKEAAYLIYTSGSTGTPKGVVVSHGALAHYVDGVLAALALPEATSMAMVSTPAADLGHTVLFAALGSGRPLHLLSSDCVADADRFADYMAANAVGVLKIVPSHLRELLGDGSRADGVPKIALILGGETSSWELVETVRRARPECRIFNHYGPTETTVGAALYEVADRDDRFASVPLGRPLPRVETWILDPHLNSVPDGVAGELYIGGDGVARGYHGQPATTAQRFVPHPARPGARLYRTGDRAVIRDGVLEFLGRTDDQVKIRGYRVEIGEVLAALRATEGVRDAAVVVDRDEGGRAKLVGFYVPADGAPPLTVIKGHLQSRLPDYMVPALTALARLPLTPHGKLDRRALSRAAAPTAIAPTSKHVAPRTPLEEALCAIWRDVLGLEMVGIGDDFFELGGDSILSLRIIARARKQGIKLTPKQLFAAKTIGALSASIEPPREPERSIIPLVARRDKSPTSFAQQRIWFLSQLETGRTAYHIAGGVRLQGELDRAALRESLRAVMERHETLRTVFPIDDGGAMQRVLAAVPIVVDERDLRAEAARSGASLEAAIEALSREDAARPFDLERGPLLRTTLLQVDDREHVLLLTLHHIIADGWSMNVLMREFAETYQARGVGASAARSPLSIQYRDFAAWQQRWLEQGESDKQLAYWKRRLGDDPSPEPLFERPRGPRPARAAGWESVPFERAKGHGITRLAKAHETTPFAVLLAAFACLLYRHTGRRDVRLGVPSANRRLAETEELIGLFVNTQVLRIDVGGETTFVELLASVKEAILDAQAHQDVPFDRVVEALAAARRLGETPLFQVICNHQKRETKALRALPGLTLERYERTPAGAQFDLGFDSEQDDDGEIRAVLHYAKDVFETPTVARLAVHFARVLDQAIAEPHRRIAEIDVLANAELRELRQKSGVVEVLPAFEAVHVAIARQARRAPDATALLFGRATMTYRELEHQSNRWALRLRELGVGPEIPVGILLGRSFEMVVAVLAVLKAGGAYVPIEPDLPASRIAYILSNSGVPIVLTSGEIARSRALPDEIRVVAMNEREDTPREPSDCPAVALSAPSIAYIIYTSGSTGRPKGAANTHGGLANRLAWMQDAYRLDASDTVLQKTPFSFDVSVWELLWPLMAGARVRLALPGEHREPSRLVEIVVEDRITTLHFVPSMLGAFLEAEGVERCTSLRRIVASGEALGRDAITRAAVRLPGATLVNLYGPTEASIDVTHWTCTAQEATGVVPIGAPIANTVIRILDADLNEVPAGVAGELYIGGVGLARGYWQNGPLTADRFIPDPTSSVPGTRLYRTGDRARLLADGNFEFLGRTDDQVKVRGFRVELGEIEAALARLPGVEQAVAVVRDDGRGGRIVAYVVPRGVAAEVETADWKRWLREILPEFMVPHAIVPLERLPRLPSGKIDKKALPAVDAPREQHVPPQTAMERRIAPMWQTLLGVASVGRSDDFFELGGHSLLAVRLVAETKRELGAALPLETIFRAPTLERFAAEVERAAARALNDDQLQNLDALLTELEGA
jgi:amino acid adenylation domain-containing protein/non-ribosomal peptide synthase protein (TIGR01720 family)